MEPRNAEQIRILLGRSGLEVPQERLESLAKTFEEYRSRLELLYSVNVENEEVAGIFYPGEHPGEEGSP